MMNIQRLVSVGCVGLFLLLAVINGPLAGNSLAAGSSHPMPVRAPIPVPAPAQATPTPATGKAPVMSQPLPQPRPAPAPPAAATAAAPIQAGLAPVGLILLLPFIGVAGSAIGLVALLNGRRKVNGRFPHPSTLAQGAHS